MITLFNPYDQDEQAVMLAAHMPIGRLWENSFNPNSNLGKLVIGLSVEMYRLEVLHQQMVDEMDINKANELLVDWEKSVGIPDTCFQTSTTLSERRTQVLEKFSKFGGVQTEADFIRVAAVFGATVRIYQGEQWSDYPALLPNMSTETDTVIRHTIFIEIVSNLVGDAFFPLPFPIPFSKGMQTFLQCIYDKLAPANVDVVFV